MSSENEVSTGSLLLLEFGNLKEEQRLRIGFRDNLLYATFASLAGVVAAIIGSSHVGFLLLLPPVSAALGWTYLVNDEKISAIGRYVRDELAPRLAALASDCGDQPVFGWEHAHRGDARRISRKWIQLAVDLLTFCAAPIAALLVFWLSSGEGAALLLVSIAEVAMTAVLCWQIIIYADLRPPSPSPVPSNGIA